MDQNNLRKQVRMIKATKGVSYKEVAETLEICQSSMYNWLRNQYDLSDRKAQRLIDIITDLED